MITPLAKVTLLVITLALPALLTACAGRKVSTSVADQTFVPGPSRQALAERPKGETPAATRPAEETRITEAPIVSAVPRTPVALSARPTQPSALSDVYFDFDQFLIRADAQPVLEADARLLKAAIGQQILLEGHCDERGTLAYNLVLGERRARAVKQYLEDLGVAASAIQITSYGKERPFCREHSDACWQSNRRAHFAQK
jgi:peptidoglycan-associated lipoprotein